MLPRLAVLLSVALLSRSAGAAPIIDPLGNVNLAVGKSLILPVTASSPEGRTLTYTAFSSTNRFTVEVHTNNPFWKLAVVQAVTNNPPGAFQTPFREGVVTVTNIGEMTFMLFSNRAPRSVDMLMGLTAGGYYTSNTLFHRVAANFVVQGGAASTNAATNAVFILDDELHPRALFRGNGQLGLARVGKDESSSQFFITLGAQPNLDLRYTLCGQLVRGFDVLSRIGSVATNASGRPLQDVIVTRASRVPNLTDTVITLVASNLVGVTGTVRVVADDGAGGRTTNTFTATTVADGDTVPMLINPPATNLFVPMNGRLTNAATALDLDGNPFYFDVFFLDAAAETNATGSVFSSAESTGAFVVVPNPGYTGPLRFYAAVSPDPTFFIYFDYQEFTVAVGDTPISAWNTNWVARPGVGFTNQVLAVFTNGVFNSPAANFTAFINWGDNSTNSGTIVTAPNGWKEVRGTHTFTNGGNYPVYITITSSLGASAKVISTAVVPPALSLGSVAGKQVIKWPAWAADYQLQMHTNVSTTNWSAATNLPALVGFDRVITNSFPASNVFYRLRR